MIEQNSTPNRLYRSRQDRMVAGVAAGLAQYVNVDPVLVRLGFVILTLMHGAGLLAYIIMTIVVPQRPLDEAEPIVAASAAVRQSREVIGVGLVGLGLLLLASNLGVFGGIQWDRFWPLVLIGLGLFILVRQRD